MAEGGVEGWGGVGRLEPEGTGLNSMLTDCRLGNALCSLSVCVFCGLCLCASLYVCDVYIYVCVCVCVSDMAAGLNVFMLDR